MTCPDCQSDRAVDKAEAWDALTKIPPKTERELDKLRGIEEAARNLVVSSPASASSQMSVTYVPTHLLDALRGAFT